MNDSPSSTHPSAPVPSKADQLALKDQFDFALKHFLFVADQRLKTFNFYAVFLVASVGATITTSSGEKISARTFTILGLFHILIAIVFFIIERRNTALIKISTTTLIALESQSGFPGQARIFSRDDADLKTWWQKLMSYRSAFYLAYIAQFSLGLGVLYCAFFVAHPADSGNRCDASDDAVPAKLLPGGHSTQRTDIDRGKK